MTAAKIIGALAGSFAIAYVCDTVISEIPIILPLEVTEGEQQSDDNGVCGQDIQLIVQESSIIEAPIPLAEDYSEHLKSVQEKGKKKIMPEVVRRSGRLLKADATTILEKADKRAAIKSLEITESTNDGGPKGIAGLLAIKNKELLLTQMQGISEDETEQREIVVTNTERAIAGREYVINSQGRDSSHMEIGEGFEVAPDDNIFGQQGMEIIMLD